MVGTRPASAVWSEDQGTTDSFYEPLRQPLFRWFWVAAIFSMIALWVHDVANAWFMRDLTNADPFLVSLIQAATSLPVVFLSLPMGTVSDLWDRRHFLVTAQIWMLVMLVALWLVTVSDLMTPTLLIVLTAGLGIGKAMLLPGFSALIPQLISRKQLHLGVGLHGMANNSARIIGPALAGGMLMVVGVAAVYAFNLLLVLISLLLLLTWRWRGDRSRRERGFVSEVGAGLAYCARNQHYRTILVRVILFFVAASSVHALLPVLVQQAGSFGMSWGMYGLGAVAGAVVFPLLSRTFNTHGQITFGILGHGVFLGCLVLAPNDLARMPVLLMLGVFWFQSMCATQVSLQTTLPDAMRARGMGVFTMIAMACFGLGAPLWGAVAKATSPDQAILAATTLSLAALALTYRLRWSTAADATD
jgi:MFS family permease